MLYFRRARQLSRRLLARLRDIQLGPEEQSIGTLQLADDAFVEPGPRKSHAVEAIQFHRIPYGFEEWRNVLRDARASTDERVPPDLHELVHGNEPGKNRAIFDGDVPGQLRSVRDNDAVTQVTIVREVHVRHQEAALPHYRLEGVRRAAVDRAVFADARAFADFDPRLLALELEVLRVATEH